MGLLCLLYGSSSLFLPWKWLIKKPRIRGVFLCEKKLGGLGLSAKRETMLLFTAKIAEKCSAQVIYFLVEFSIVERIAS